MKWILGFLIAQSIGIASADPFGGGRRLDGHVGCESAIDLGSDTMEIDGSTLGLEADDLVNCKGVFDDTSIGVWYRTTGTGNTHHAHTCHPNTDHRSKLSVFRGSDCENPDACIDNEERIDDGNCVRNTWNTEEGETYFIHVHGEDLATGNFRLTTGPIAADTCENAMDLEPGSSIYGTTSQSGSSDVEVCEDNTPSARAGAWYQLFGDGARWEISTCDEETDFNDSFDTQIAVYEGVCGALTCVAGNDDDPNCGLGAGDVLSTVEFDAREGTFYFIFVHGFHTLTGGFTLTANTVGTVAPTTPAPGTPVPTPDPCTGIPSLPVGIPVTGNILLNIYEVEGTGRTFFARACASSAFVVTHIDVWTGTCILDGDLIAFGDNACDEPVEWESEVGVTYYLSLSATLPWLALSGEEDPDMTLLVSENLEDLEQLDHHESEDGPPGPPPDSSDSYEEESSSDEDGPISPPIIQIIEDMVQLMTDMVAILPQMLELIQYILEGASRIFSRN